MLGNEEHVESALAAGLRYVSETIAGIRRRRSGRGFTYVTPEGTPLRDPATLTRIRKLVIPPAWTDVWICPIDNGHLQVTARDAKGRKQYRYHARYREVRDETKFGRMIAFSEVLPQIRERVERDIALPELKREKILATVVWLLERTLIRVGKDEYARDNGSYGLTTMRRRHVAVSGATLRFEFKGKSGVQHAISVTDRRIARIVQRCQELPGQELFRYVDEEGKRCYIDAGDINDYLREITGRQVTAKDFRTWGGTMLAATTLRSLGTAATEKEAKANLIRAVDLVAKYLGNTRAVCRKYYVHPVIIESYLGGYVLPGGPPDKVARRQPPGPAALRKDEIAVVELLRARSKGTPLELPRVKVESDESDLESSAA